MCGIIGSFDKDILLELAQKNSSRGNKAYSLTVVNPKKSKILNIIKDKGSFTQSILEQVEVYNPKHPYYILHIQSPTAITSLTERTIHPAMKEGSSGCSLWHNGMLLDDTIKNINIKYSIEETWDTELLLNLLVDEGFSGLNDIQGSFGCIYTDGKKFYIFRNDIIPLYIDDNLNISSAKFQNSIMIESNKVYEIDFKNKQIIEIETINNGHNPYLV